jgi:hypothetical protein
MWSIDPIVGQSLPRQSAEVKNNLGGLKNNLKRPKLHHGGDCVEGTNRYTDKSLPLDTPREQKLFELKTKPQKYKKSAKLGKLKNSENSKTLKTQKHKNLCSGAGAHSEKNTENFCSGAKAHPETQINFFHYSLDCAKQTEQLESPKSHLKELKNSGDSKTKIYGNLYSGAGAHLEKTSEDFCSGAGAHPETQINFFHYFLNCAKQIEQFESSKSHLEKLKDPEDLKTKIYENLYSGAGAHSEKTSEDFCSGAGAHPETQKKFFHYSLDCAKQIEQFESPKSHLKKLKNSEDSKTKIYGNLYSGAGAHPEKTSEDFCTGAGAHPETQKNFFQYSLDCAKHIKQFESPKPPILNLKKLKNSENSVSEKQNFILRCRGTPRKDLRRLFLRCRGTPRNAENFFNYSNTIPCRWIS